MDSFESIEIERAKISCAKKLFDMNFSDVKYDVVSNYSQLLNIMNK